MKVCADPRHHARKGPTDSQADIRRIEAHTGWIPRIPFEQSLADLWSEANGSHEAGGRYAGRPLPLTA